MNIIDKIKFDVLFVFRIIKILDDIFVQRMVFVHIKLVNIIFAAPIVNMGCHQSCRQKFRTEDTDIPKGMGGQKNSDTSEK